MKKRKLAKRREREKGRAKRSRSIGDERIDGLLKEVKMDVPGASNDALMRILMLVRDVDKAVEKAVKAEREACARSICRYCAGRSRNVCKVPYKAGDEWTHLSVRRRNHIYMNYRCAATQIYNRNKANECFITPQGCVYAMPPKVGNLQMEVRK